MTPIGGRGRPAKEKSAKRLTILEKTTKEGEALLKDLGHKADSDPDSTRRQTRSQTRGTPPAPPPVKKTPQQKPPKKVCILFENFDSNLLLNLLFIFRRILVLEQLLNGVEDLQRIPLLLITTFQLKTQLKSMQIRLKTMRKLIRLKVKVRKKLIILIIPTEIMSPLVKITKKINRTLIRMKWKKRKDLQK